MKAYWKGHHDLAVIAVLVLAALLGACGTDDPTGSTTQTQAGLVTESAGTVGLMTCTSCHTAATADWMLTKHANVEPAGNLYSAGNPTLRQIATCLVMCHDPQGDSGQLVEGYTGNTQRPVVGCESCHGGGEFHVAAGGSGPINRYAARSGSTVTGPSGTVVRSGQFNTCTTCHELLLASDPAGTTPATAEHSGTTPTGATYVITDTHFATPGSFTGTGGVNVNDATGYSMNYSSETVCSDCHNPHKSADINREWAQSAHADKYATDDPLGYFSTAWAHYDWTVASRRPCQRCHTTSGFSAYADALLTGDSARAKGINQGTITILSFQATPSFKPEMLKCNGCHTNNKGTLRNPGAITANYDLPIPIPATGKPFARASYAYPDVNGSNVCMVCHTGRESGDTVKGLNDPDMVNLALQTAGTHSFFDFGSNGFINSHYLTAGGTVFAATGFEFEGRSYENLSTYRHDQIGSSAVPNTGTNGPCIGCHMSRPAGSGDHFFMPVTRSADTPGHIEGIASEVCIYCHTESGMGGLADLINERKEEYFEAVEATMYVLDKRGFYFRGANPYFFQKRTSTGSVASIAGTTVTGAATTWLASVSTTTGTGANNCTYGPDFFKMDNDGTYYEITAVGSDTSLTLASVYDGTVTSGKYTIIKSGSCSSQVIRNWLTLNTVRTSAGTISTGTNTVTVTGTGTAWLTDGVVPGLGGDRLLIDYDNSSYRIASVVSDTLLTLVSRPSFTLTNVTYKIAAADTDVSGNTTGRYNLGAAFNLNLLEHDPGAYVHNRIYAKRLLYDSIDWADDNLMNYSVGNTLNTFIPAGAVFRAGAMKYLLPYGVLGIAAERP